MGIGEPVFNTFKDFFTKQRIWWELQSVLIYSLLCSSMQGFRSFALHSIHFWRMEWLENNVISFADDTTLYAKIASSFYCINVNNSSNIDLVKVQLWCSMWGIKLNPSKTHSLIISQYQTLFHLIYYWNCVNLTWKSPTYLKLLILNVSSYND